MTFGHYIYTNKCCLHNIQKMTQEEFSKNYTELKPFLVGHGRTVSDRAKVPYYTYRNAINGQISNGKVLGRIYAAMLSVVKDRAEALISLTENTNL